MTSTLERQQKQLLSKFNSLVQTSVNEEQLKNPKLLDALNKARTFLETCSNPTSIWCVGRTDYLLRVLLTLYLVKPEFVPRSENEKEKECSS